MRSTFVNTLIKLAEKDKDIYLLSADLGYSAFEEFIKKFPERFINCGVAEQNMIGVAAGLALSGKKPYVYSIIPFVTMRCFEQIRNDICYQNLNVKIIGFGGGFTYGTLGVTHFALEDIAILRVLPNLIVLCPADAAETKELTLKSYQMKQPVYLRLSRSAGIKLYKKRPVLEIGKPSVIKQGRDGAIISFGVQVGDCLRVIGDLKKDGYNFKLISLPTIKPINKKALLNELKGIKRIFTVEEHSVIGGLGAATSEILAEADWAGTFKIIGLPSEYPKKIGEPDYLRNLYSLSEKKITQTILTYLKHQPFKI